MQGTNKLLIVKRARIVVIYEYKQKKLLRSTVQLSCVFFLADHLLD